MSAESLRLDIPVGLVPPRHEPGLDVARKALPPIGAALRRPPALWIARLLAVPLAGKLAGASAIVVAAAISTAMFVRRGMPIDRETLIVMVAALVLSLIVNLVLVVIALRPLRDLEVTAERVSKHDLDARVPTSPLADRDFARVGKTFNRVLDELIADRARMRRLASEVIREGDRQRASISRELHDSAAQSLAALMFEVTAAARLSTDPELTARLETMHTYAIEVLDEVRLLAQRVHPRVLDDLGLAAALERLARGVREAPGIRIDVDADLAGICVPPGARTVLYRVAEEAVANAVRHGSAKTIGINLSADARTVRLSVVDDGRGFGPASLPLHHPGVGLFTMRERVALAGGIFEVESRPGAGTVISAIVPLGAGDILDAG